MCVCVCVCNIEVLRFYALALFCLYKYTNFE